MRTNANHFFMQLNRARAGGRRWRPRTIAAALAFGAALGVLMAPVDGAEAQSQGPRGCGIAMLQGEATVERAGASMPAAIGMALATNDRLASGADARVEIRCTDGVRLNLGANTSLDLATLAAPAAATRNVALRLLDGVVRVALPSLRSWRYFEVQTPTAVASVRSTDWIVQAGEKGATAVFVGDGQVLASDRAGSKGAFLQAGEGIDFSADGGMTASVRWGAPRVERTLAAVMPR